MKEERKRRVLGKGLGSLIPEVPARDRGDVLGDDAPRATAGSPLEISIDDITPNPHQPRRHFDEEELASLAESIRASGVLQPLLVRREPYRGYTLIAGERRLRAAKLAGLSTVPVIVRQFSEQGMLEAALVENIQRDDLGPMETARAFRVLVREFGITQAEVAERVGKPRSSVANYLRLLDLAADVQALLEEGKLDMGHGRALAGLDRADDQARLAKQAVALRWSVRQVEDQVRRVQEGTATPRSRQGEKTVRDPNVVAAESALSRALEAKVRIDVGAKGKGRIEVLFGGDEDLDRLYRLLLKAARRAKE